MSDALGASESDGHDYPARLDIEYPDGGRDSPDVLALGRGSMTEAIGRIGVEPQPPTRVPERSM